MAKKQKWSFVDLDDKDFETINNNVQKDEKDLLNINLNDLKNEVAPKQEEPKKETIVVSKEEEQAKEVKEEKEQIVENTSTLTEEDFGPIKKVATKKINYEVNYDDILEPEKSNDRKIISELFEKKEEPKKISNSQNPDFKNLKPRSTLKTYNEALKKQEKKEEETQTFEDDKIKQFLTVKEKLDIKTNIYLKSSVVLKLRELEEKTNESRSSIINKLIEIALKSME